ncbi:hypothetical protein EV356DRAFT_447289 [Viridothelium virens]|uniref:Uncharacterized protein n=1 Tax=Viridothelium virens TaxID=1048519 RepID=A0A6A6H9C3_VIRVR|nr:hypothetical protein EV356DRAFT_447289 [Viridothelium virens]
MYMPNSLWTWSFFVTAAVQAIITLFLESYVFGKFQADLKNGAESKTTQAKTIVTYLSLFIFGFLYQIALVYDALRLQNTIQVIGLCAYNVGMLIYAAVQVGQINDAVAGLGRMNDVDPALWHDVRPYLIAVPCVLGLGTVVMAFLAWKLYDEFAWKIYKHISADLRLKRRYLVYQIYIALLKFDFFFFLGFTVQFLVVVRGTTNVEFYLTIVAVPVTIAVLFMAAYWVRKENRVGMVIIIILYFGALAYFLFKLFRMYGHSERVQDYLPTRRSLTVFAIITVLMLVSTIVNAVWCTYNFNKGLKPHLGRHQTQGSEDNKTYQQEFGMPTVSGSGQGQSRMTID